GQALVTDGSGNLSWGSTGFTVVASTTTNLNLATTLASDTTAGITPSNVNAQVWITANVIASTTASSTVTLGVFKTSACTTRVGTVTTSTIMAPTTSTAAGYTIS